MRQGTYPLPSLRERVFQGSDTVHFGNGPGVLCGRPARYKEWNEQRMTLAMRSVMEGKSIRQSALECGIPKSTLGDRISGRVLPGKKSGPQPYLSAEEEDELAMFVTRCASIGYGKTRKDVLALVQRIYSSRGLNITISSGWWDSFVRRHPNLTLRAPAPLSRARSNSSSYEVIEAYFDLLEETLYENQLSGKPGQLYNMDESGMPLDPKPPKIVHVKGVKNPLANCSGNKAQITVVGCVSAAGHVLPPMVVWDRKTLNPKLTEGEVPGTIYGLSPKGWMDQQLFKCWFTRHFLHFIPPVRPVLLIMDGHSSHYCPDTIRLAAEEQVIVFALPPNTTHLTQPLDKGVFGPLKVSWRKVCHSYLVNNPGKVITRYDFSTLFSEAWFQSMRPENAIAGFKVTGICPFDRNAVKIPGSVDQHEGLAKKHDLAFIPLYTPSKRSCSSVSKYSNKEMENFESAYELGFSPGRYRNWLKVYHPEDVENSSNCSFDSVPSTPLSFSRSPSPQQYLPAARQPALHRFLSMPCLIEKPKQFQPPEKCARVLTSAECLQKLQDKEDEKKANQKMKEEKRRKREENRKLKEENKKKKEENKKKKEENRKGGSKTTKVSETKKKEMEEGIFTNEEVALFTIRYENGYDIPDDRYLRWLKMFDPQEAQKLMTSGMFLIHLHTCIFDCTYINVIYRILLDDISLQEDVDSESGRLI